MSTVCRVCLAGGGNVTLSRIENIFLTDFYEKLTDFQFFSEDGRPRVLCCFCYQRLLSCRTLSEMACRSEQIFSDLFFEGLEATHEIIEDLNLRTNQHLSKALMRISHLDDQTPNNSSPIIIKEEPVSVKEEENIQNDDLVDTNSVDTYISEECIKNELIFEEDSNEGNYLIENSTEMVIKQLKLETDIAKLESDEAQGRNQKVKVHPDKLKTFCCDICSKIFLVRSKLVSHQLSHTKEQRKRFDKKGSDVNLKGHKNDNTGVKPYHCNLCDKQFNRNYHLVRHMIIHTGEKPYACSICKKQFNFKDSLEIRIHTGKKLYRCNICHNS